MSSQPLGLFIQPACLQHKYIRHPNSSHIFERPERLRAVLLGVAAAIARLEVSSPTINPSDSSDASARSSTTNDDLSSLLSSLSISTTTFSPPSHVNIVSPPQAGRPGQVLQHHPALQLAHSPPPDEHLFQASNTASSTYLKDLLKWASEAVEQIKETGCEIPSGLGLNQGDLYLGPGSVIAIEGAIQTVCQAIDKVCNAAHEAQTVKNEPSTPPVSAGMAPPIGSAYFDKADKQRDFTKAFCAIRPPGHHCGEDEPSGFCYVNNVVVGALHGYLEHDIDRAIIIDFDLHHGNGTQALVMPLNAASYAEDLAVKAGKPPITAIGRKGKRRRTWKSFYGSVHDIYSYPCEDGDLDLISDASISLAAHGQYIENIHLQPYSSEDDFYERIYPKYTNLLDKAKVFMEETQADPERTIVLISAGFDACEHEHQAMQRHDRRVPVSFFSRYTRDIVQFANRYTQGKVVSVLEGGYSDRALTSAAMGHVLGMLDQPGEPEWWTESELINIERCTKKKRTGKIGPFPPELSSHAHLVRTHALLAHFEGSAVENMAASAQSTPLHGSRMTLRDRRKPVEDDIVATPPVRKVGRGRGGATPKSTPGRVKKEEKVEAQVELETGVNSENRENATTTSSSDVDGGLVRPMTELANDSLGGATAYPATSVTSLPAAFASASTTFSSVPPQHGAIPASTGSSSLASLPPLPSIPSMPSSSAWPQPGQETDLNRGDTHMSSTPITMSEQSTEQSQQKVFLRFTRPTSADPPSQQPLYPALPAASGMYRYRGVSEGPSTESDGEYVSARSELSEKIMEGRREL